jgi:hypothetical protein
LNSTWNPKKYYEQAKSFPDRCPFIVKDREGNEKKCAHPTYETIEDKNGNTCVLALGAHVHAPGNPSMVYLAPSCRTHNSDKRMDCYGHTMKIKDRYLVRLPGCTCGANDSKNEDFSSEYCSEWS